MRVIIRLSCCLFIILSACKPAPITPPPPETYPTEENILTTVIPTISQPPTEVFPTQVEYTPTPQTTPESFVVDFETGQTLGGGTILLLVIDPGSPGTLYALTYTGTIFKTSDGGESWSVLNHGLEQAYLGWLAIDPATPTTLYGTSNGMGLFKTTDGGENWQKVSDSIKTNEFSSLTIDPRQTNTLYVDAEDGLYRSKDAGETWSRINPDLNYYEMDELSIDPNKSSTLYAVAGGGVLKSTNSGENWKNIVLPGSLHVSTLTIDPITPNILYMATDQGIYKSMDSGGSWKPAGTGIPKGVIVKIAIDPVRPITLYAAVSGAGLFKSVNGGLNWDAYGAGQNSSQIISIAINPQTPVHLYAGTMDCGVIKSTDGGKNWRTMNHGLGGGVVAALVVEPQASTTLYAGTWGAGVYKSENLGKDWRAVNTGLNDPRVMDLVVDPQRQGTLYALTEGGYLFKTVDGGESWNKLTNSPVDSTIYCLVFDPGNHNNIYAGTTNGVLKSTDGGETWSFTSPGLPDTSVNQLAVDPDQSNTLYASTYQGKLFKSIDGGAFWNASDQGLNHALVLDLLIDSTASNTVYAGTDRGLYLSTDGKDWNPVSAGLPGDTAIRSLTADPMTPGTMYAITGLEVYQTLDNGISWTAFNTGLTGQMITTLMLNPLYPDVLFVGTWSGIVKAIHANGDLNPTPEPTSTITPPTPSTNPFPASQDWQANMDNLAQDIINNTPLAGMTLAVRRQGEPDWIRGYGYADLEESILATDETIYPIGSLSMPFTAAAIMQLAERGQVNLNAPIVVYLDSLPMEIQGFSLRQLLNHSSMIYTPASDFQEIYFGPQFFNSASILQELIPKLQINTTDIFNHFSYGNYLLAGLVVEKASGLSYADYLNQFIIAPAGLVHTSYCLPSMPSEAKTYYLPQGQFVPIQLNISAVFAAGGLCSTAGDLLNWTDALASGKVILPESYQQMITPEQLPDGTLSSFGYGVFILPDPYGQQVDAIGMEASFSAYLISYPHLGLTIVLLSNTAIPDNNLLEKLWSSIPLLMP